MHVTKPIDLALLDRELTAAGVAHGALSRSGTDTDGELLMLPPSGVPPSVDLPPAAGPVVDAHVAPPPITSLAGSLGIATTVRTTDATATEAYRLTLQQRHGYRADCRLTAIDATNGALHSWEARFVFKRLVGSAIRVGYTFVSDISDTGATAWSVTAAPAGSDMVVTVTGAAGRTIDWLLVGEVGVYAPDGL